MSRFRRPAGDVLGEPEIDAIVDHLRTKAALMEERCEAVSDTAILERLRADGWTIEPPRTRTQVSQ